MRWSPRPGPWSGGLLHLCGGGSGGRASILVPYPHAGDHQRANAGYLADRGAAVLVRDGELDGDRLVAEALALRDDDARTRMADAARRLGRPDAAR